MMFSPTTAAKRILLFAEAVTLAHVARPLAFARAIAADCLAVACDEPGLRYVQAEGVERIALKSIEPAAFVRALAQGKPLYDVATLRRYIEDDLRVIGEFRPDLIVGDFRLSLSVSARLAGIPYATLASAYWSPHYRPPVWPVPELLLTRFLPIGAAQVVFGLARPLAFQLHCAPLNALRREHRLPPLPHDLRGIYTDADYVLYTDLPALFPLAGAPLTHRFIGPVLWEPAIDLPPWWNDLPDDRDRKSVV